MRRAKKKGTEVQNSKPPTSARAIDELMGDEEQTGTKKREQGKKQGADLLSSDP